MIVARLSGGVGNQLFQYAAGRALAAFRDAELQVSLELYQPGVEPEEPRRYEIDRFVADPVIAEPASIAQYPVYWEAGFHFDPGLFDAPTPTLLAGNYQSERYFASVEDLIRADLEFKTPPAAARADLLEIIESTESVAVHVRRGDYLEATSRNVNLCDVGYFRRAAAQMAESLQSPHFIVFSDDSDWTRRLLRLGYPTTFVEPDPSGYGSDDMQLISLCRHQIIANSTFGWWGAWLNASPDRQVIGPSRWFRDPGVITADVMPPEWLRVPSDETIRRRLRGKL